MEKQILMALNFDVFEPTTSTFLKLYNFVMTEQATSQHKVAFLAQFLADLMLISQESMEPFLPSLIASTCLMVANYILHGGKVSDALKPRDRSLFSEWHSLEALERCSSKLLDLWLESQMTGTRMSRFQAVYSKFTAMAKERQ